MLFIIDIILFIKKLEFNLLNKNFDDLLKLYFSFY